MRVFRVEVTQQTRCGWAGTLRPERFGAFAMDLIPYDLYSRTPAPHEDFHNGDWKDTGWFKKSWYFAFPSMEPIIEFIDKFATDILVAEYEVEPVYVSRHQVVFDERTAIFLGEKPIAQIKESLTAPAMCMG